MASSLEQTFALPLPAGQTLNPIDPASLWKYNLVSVVVCLSTTTILLLLRCYVRLCIKRQWILEDYMCCISWALLVSLCALNTTLMDRHGGVHGWDLTASQAREAIFWVNIQTIVYGPAILSTKVAILLLFRRVFSPQKRNLFDLAIRLFILVLCLFYVAITLVKIFECTPRSRIWDKSQPGTCVSVAILLDVSGLFNLLTDVLILLIPIKAVWSLQTDAKRKVGVVLVFTVGFMAPVFSMIGSIVRIKTSKSPDLTYNQPEILLWGAAEVTAGLICVCTPTLAVITHTRNSRRQAMRMDARSGRSRRYNWSHRTQPASLNGRDLIEDSDWQLQPCSVEAAGTLFPSPAVITGISSGGRTMHVKGDASCKIEINELTNEMDKGCRAIGVTTTIEIEKSYL